LSDKGTRGDLQEKPFEEEKDREGVATRGQGRGIEKECEEKQGCREDIKEDGQEICEEIFQEIGREESLQKIGSNVREEDKIKEACFGAETNEHCRKNIIHQQEGKSGWRA
jgi:hypothetical protein